MALNLTAAMEFLLGRQAADGAWKSITYGPLKNGAATTSLTLYAFSHLPAAASRPHRQRLQAACQFLQPGIVKRGAVAAPDGTLDYPMYGSAMLLLAAARLKLELDAAPRAQLVEYLLTGQLSAEHGIVPTSVHLGGWDLDTARGAKGDQLRGSNISLGSFALEALSESQHPGAAAAIERGRRWVLRCQNADGGFVFHTWRRHPGNKAKWSDDQEQAISYATPTCDGLRSLRYCGLTDQDEVMRKATKWLETHPDVSRVPGFDAKAKEDGWDLGLRYYYFFTQAKALAAMPPAEARRRADVLLKVLAGEQRPDGSFKNAHPRMFEDDPLLATSLALIAAAEAQRVVQQKPQE